MNFDHFSLHEIRSQLIRLEDSIIFGLIERSQFALNSDLYTTIIPEINQTLLHYFLHEQESIYSKIRRYTSPDEIPFSTSPLPCPILPLIQYPPILAPNNVNINQELLTTYINQILPTITKGSDSNWGSCCEKDVLLLQHLSRRIHYGKFVAEAKFNDPNLHETYCELIKKRDEEGIMNLLTNHKVEQKLLKRIRQKVLLYGQQLDDTDQDVDGDGGSMPTLRMSPLIISNMYENIIIPLTKKVEVEYLLCRLDTDFVSFKAD